MIKIDNPKYHAQLQVDIKTNSDKTMKVLELAMEKVKRELNETDYPEVDVTAVVHDLSPKQK